MNHELFFEIPEGNFEVMTALVTSIPSDWAWVDGLLSAPSALIESGAALKHTGFELSRFHGNPMFKTLSGQKSEFLGIMARQKRPGFVEFDEVGISKSLSLEDAKGVAVGFLAQGYVGRLLFYRSCHRNIKYDNSARCDFRFAHWDGTPIFGNEAGPQPARVKLEWNERYFGTKEDLDPILAVCKQFNLREYTLVGSDEALA